MKIFTLIFALLISNNILSQSFPTQDLWETYFKNKSGVLDPIEGIWSVNYNLKVYSTKYNFQKSENRTQALIVAIFKNGNKYDTHIISSTDYSPNSSTDFKGERTDFFFTPTAIPGIYLVELKFLESKTSIKANASFKENGILDFFYEDPVARLKYFTKKMGEKWIEGIGSSSDHQWIKLYPTIKEFYISNKVSGTGFGIASNGIIVTNFHVIKNAKDIKVKGLNSDFGKSYNAKILISDKNNDLALIQIDDYKFTSLGTIPYTLKTMLTNVGENVFVLGYPLRSSMGDEIKLTNGIISSKTGFQGDITSFQISAPIQPGNSGGPLFDNEGNLIGVVNAKHLGAENASYAIKANYLSNLIDLLPNPIIFQSSNKLVGKSLSQQVEILKKYVYIIEAE